MAGTMKTLNVNPDLTATIKDVPIPTPGPNELLIKVDVVGSNPKDWKIPTHFKQTSAAGDDIVGTVKAIGSEVYEFRKGDRIFAWRNYNTVYSGYGEYALVFDFISAKIPEKVSSEEAATVPLAALTAAVALYHTLRLPQPWAPVNKPTPIVIWGAASACGAFGVKLAHLSNIHPIIAVAGAGKDFVETLIDRSKGDEIVDYRGGSEQVVKSLKAALAKSGFDSVDYAFDAISGAGSVADIGAVVSQGGSIAGVSDLWNDPKAEELRKDIKFTRMTVGWCWEKEWPEGSEEKKQGLGPGTIGSDFGHVLMKYMAKGLAEGWFKGHPYEVVEGGLHGVSGALQRLKDKKASAVKYVHRISDTKY